MRKCSTPGTQKPPVASGAGQQASAERGADHVGGVCPICQGDRWLRSPFPFGHPQYTSSVACACLLTQRREKRFQEMLTLCERAGFQRGKRLETYHPQVKGVQPAFRATKHFIERLEEWAAAREDQGEASPAPGHWLVLIGPVGVGKTHLLMAIGNAALAVAIPTLFSPVPDVLDDLRETFDPQSATSYDTRFQEMKTIDLLLLDDLGTESSTVWATEKLFQLLNYRYTVRLPTVITLNSRVWQHLDERLHSRLSDGGLVQRIQMDHAQDYRQRKAPGMPED